MPRAEVVEEREPMLVVRARVRRALPGSAASSRATETLEPETERVKEATAPSGWVEETRKPPWS